MISVARLCEGTALENRLPNIFRVFIGQKRCLDYLKKLVAHLQEGKKGNLVGYYQNKRAFNIIQSQIAQAISTLVFFLKQITAMFLLFLILPHSEINYKTVT